MKLLPARLCHQLVSDGWCGSLEEAEAIVESVFDENELSLTSCQEGLQQHLDISSVEARMIFAAVQKDEDTGDESDLEECTLSSGSETHTSCMGPETDEEEEYLEDGHCELCERYVRLTKHHLFPKSTWPRLQARLERAVRSPSDSITTVGESCVNAPLVALLSDFLGDQKRTSHSTRAHLRRALSHHTCTICRPCHDFIHRRFDNWTLAEEYASVEALVSDEKIRGHCMWVNKQKPGKYRVYR